MNEGVYKNNSTNKDITLKGKLYYKTCSFSGEKALKSELMWGHYANAGKGVVIEINIENCENIESVEYGNICDYDNIKDILRNKSNEWSYEDEYRYMLTDETCNKIKIGTIKKIHFGTPYKHLLNYRDIIKNHKPLSDYLDLKTQLEDLCEEKGICCEDFNFS
ncbi:MAG: DUF2971 domain-containing protein [Sulfurospirillum sp.]|nr:DUF2971 domain-containing protein [Sulfurospirillum sp.]